MSSTEPTEPDLDSFTLMHGFTLPVTDPEPPTDYAQAWNAVVLEPIGTHDPFVQLWLAAPPDGDTRPFAAPEDSDTLLLSPAEARELAAELLVRADTIDPPKTDLQCAIERRRVVLYDRYLRSEPRLGLIRPDWIDNDRHPGLYPVELDQYNPQLNDQLDPVERRAYLHGDHLLPVLEKETGTVIVQPTMPPLEAYCSAAGEKVKE